MKLFNFQSRLDYVTAMKRIRLEDPSISLPELEALALEEVFNKAPKSRAYYRYWFIENATTYVCERDGETERECVWKREGRYRYVQTVY